MKKAVSALLVLLCFVAACNRDPNVAKKKYVDNGNRYYDKAKYKEALIMYRNALKRDMRYGEAYYRSALAELKLARYAEAARDLQRAVELQPEQSGRSPTPDEFVSECLPGRSKASKAAPDGTSGTLRQICEEFQRIL